MKEYAQVEGMGVYILPSKKFKTTSVGIFIHCPLERETVTKNALIPLVLKKGSEKFPTHQKISKYLEELYGAVFDTSIVKKGERHIIQAYIEVVNDTMIPESPAILEKAVQFLYEILYKPFVAEDGFSKQIVDMQKQNLQHQIEARMNDKKEYAGQRCIEEMCKEEPFGIYGDGYVEDLQGIDEKNLYEHYKQLLEKSWMDIYIIGEVDPEEAAKMVKHIFRIPSGAKRTMYDTVNKKDVTEVKHIEEKMNITQGKLVMGYRTMISGNEEGLYSLMVMNGILGGGPHSKLFQNVREKESLCYYINSMTYRLKGLLFIHAGIEFENYEKTVAIIEKQLEAIKNGDISSEEMEGTIQSLSNQFEGMQDHGFSIIDFYVTQNMLQSDITIENMIERIKKVAKEDVMKAVQGVKLDTVYFLRGE